MTGAREAGAERENMKLSENQRALLEDIAKGVGVTPIMRFIPKYGLAYFPHTATFRSLRNRGLIVLNIENGIPRSVIATEKGLKAIGAREPHPNASAGGDRD